VPAASPSETVCVASDFLSVSPQLFATLVRYLLDKYYAAFAEKRVGLVLIASPSFGSQVADRLELIARVYNRAGSKKEEPLKRPMSSVRRINLMLLCAFP